MVHIHGILGGTNSAEIPKDKPEITTTAKKQNIISNSPEVSSAEKELSPQFSGEKSVTSQGGDENPKAKADAEYITSLKNKAEVYTSLTNDVSTPTQTKTMNIANNYKQGNIGNCVGVAIFQSFTMNELGLEYINSLVDKDANGNYVVTLHPDKKYSIAPTVIAKHEVIRGNDYVEALGCAMYMDSERMTSSGEFVPKNNSMHLAMSERGTFYRLTGLESNASVGSTKDLLAIEKALDENRGLLMTTAFSEDARSVSLVPNHAYSIVDVDVANDKVVLKNPWYESVSETKTLSIEEFQKFNTGINILEMAKDETTGKITFSNPEIGKKPGEIDYGDYFDIVAFEPCNNDYLSYIQKTDSDKSLSSQLNFSFWETFDNAGYEKFVENRDKDSSEVRISQADLAENMPFYTAMKNLGVTPIALVKYYLKNDKLPPFSNPELKAKSPELEAWVKTKINDMKYSVQIAHHNDVKAAEEAKKQAELEAKLLAEAEAKKAAELERQKLLSERKESALTEFSNNALAYRPEDFTKSVIPSEIKAKQDELKTCDGYSYNPQTRTISHNTIYRGVKTYIKFNAQGQIIEQYDKNSKGEISNKTTYKYNPDGTRLIENSYGKNLEIYDEGGRIKEMIFVAANCQKSSRTIYNYSPNGQMLDDSRIWSELVFDEENNSKIDMSQSMVEFDFSEDGSVKAKTTTYSDIYPNGRKFVHYEHKEVNMPNRVIAHYYDGAFIGLDINGKFHNIKGKDCSSSTIYYGSLPKSKDMTPEQLLQLIESI